MIQHKLLQYYLAEQDGTVQGIFKKYFLLKCLIILKDITNWNQKEKSEIWKKYKIKKKGREKKRIKKWLMILLPASGSGHTIISTPLETS